MTKKTIVITGGSRGIGLAIALKFAAEKYQIAILTKDSPEALKNLSAQIEGVGGTCLIIEGSVDDIFFVQKGVEETLSRFQTIDVVVNNTSATCFSNTLSTSPEQFDLMMNTSAKAAFFLSRAAIPALKRSSNPHIINISPPLNIEPRWLKNHLGFSLGKYAMSMCTMGMAAEFREEGIAINSLWPQTTIATPTIKAHFVHEVYESSRYPSIMADAAYILSEKDSKKCTGHFFSDEELLRDHGCNNLSRYAVNPSKPLMAALFMPKKPGMVDLSSELFLSKDL